MMGTDQGLQGARGAILSGKALMGSHPVRRPQRTSELDHIQLREGSQEASPTPPPASAARGA